MRFLFSRKILPLLLLFGFSCGLTGCFSLLWLFGEVKAVEDNPFIRGIELFICVAAGIYALWCLAKELNESDGH